MTEKESDERSCVRQLCDCQFLDKCSYAIQTFLESIFDSLGKFVAVYPWLVLSVSLLIAGAFSSGYGMITNESRASKLWVPQEARAIDEQEWVVDVFGYELRFGEILCKPHGSNALTADVVRQYWISHQLLVNTTAQASKDGRSQFPGLYSWDGVGNSTAICFESSGYCLMYSILDIVGYEYSDVSALTDDTLLDQINTESNWMSLSGQSLTKTNILGGIEYDDAGDITSAAILRGAYTIEAATVLSNNEYTDPSREGWEEAANTAIQSYNYDGVSIIAFFQTAFNNEFSNAIQGDVILFIVGYSLIFIYASMALGKRDYVHSMYGVAVCTILTVLLSVGASHGLAGFTGIIYSPMSSSLPFLILGLGVDDSFIITGEFQHHTMLYPESSITYRMQHTMRHAGVSVLITSLTDVLAFSIGASTVLPALRAYCAYAALGIVFVFLLNITFFAACVVLDARRAEANRMDCCCWYKFKTVHVMHSKASMRNTSHYLSPPDIELQTREPPNENNNNTQDIPDSNSDHSDDDDKLPYCLCVHRMPDDIARNACGRAGHLLVRTPAKIAVCTVALGMVIFSCYGASQLKQEFDLQWFIPDSSYLQEYYDWEGAYFELGQYVSIYTTDVDYYSFRDELDGASDLLTSADYLTGSTTDWHSNFWDWASNDTVTSNNYYDLVKLYLDTSGGRYSGYIEFRNASNPSEGILGAQIIGEYTQSAVKNAAHQIKAMDYIRDDVGAIGDENDIFPFAFDMIFWEQYAVITDEFYRNLLLAICCVFVITVTLIPKLSASLFVLFTVACTIIDVLGFMWLWGLTIDGVTVSYTVIAIGLAVDYSAHVGEAFMISKATTRDGRVIDALYRMGASVFNGVFSTFLAVLPLGWAETYIMRVFFMQFFLVTTLGGFHGLVVLPVLLSWFGPLTTLHQDTREASPEPEQKPVDDNSNPETNVTASVVDNKIHPDDERPVESNVPANDDVLVDTNTSG